MQLAEQDGVVSLAHRSGAKNACHAVVSEPEPDTRSWLRRQLNAADPEVDVRPRTDPHAAANPRDDVSTAGVDELLRLARQAVVDYDYETAEAYLTLAFELDQGRTDAALALLDLWVGGLGTDQQALEIELRLSYT